MPDRAALALVNTSPALDLAARAPLPAHVRYVGPELDPAPATESWDDPGPLVVAGFSSTLMDQRAPVLAALAQLRVRGLLTTGPALGTAGLVAPENVVIRRWVPHAAVLPHAGLGTVHAAPAAEVPLVWLPGGRDQGDNAARVVAAGAGVRLSRRAGARCLRAAIADPALKAGAARMAATFEDGASHAADALEGPARA